MKVLAIRGDRGGCGKYRIDEPARVTKALGLDISVDEAVDAVAYKNSHTGLITVKELYVDADVLIIQRPLDHSSSGIIEQAKKQGITTIVDIDDDFLGISQQNTAYNAVHGNPNSNVDWLTQACESADWVTVSSPALEKYAPHGRVSVLRNYVPESIFDIKPRYERIESVGSVGWTGSTGTHPADLQVTRGRIGEVLEHNDLTFGVVGDGERVRSFLNIPYNVEVRTTGWVDLDEYYSTMVSHFDIGIVPLEECNFNQAKSHLKGMEMAALGIPFIVSPTREYLRLESYGVGKTTKSVGDWGKLVQRWVDRPYTYMKDAKSYREAVKAEFTYEQHAQEWVDTWEKAYDFRRTSS